MSELLLRNVPRDPAGQKTESDCCYKGDYFVPKPTASLTAIDAIC